MSKNIVGTFGFGIFYLDVYSSVKNQYIVYIHTKYNLAEYKPKWIDYFSIEETFTGMHYYISYRLKEDNINEIKKDLEKFNKLTAFL